MAPRKTKTSAAIHKEKVEESGPAEVEVQGDVGQLAQRLWQKRSTKKPATTKVKVKDISEIWEILEKENFAFKILLSLENLQILERYASLFDLL